jgi:hypothetical protein
MCSPVLQHLIAGVWAIIQKVELCRQRGGDSI